MLTLLIKIFIIVINKYFNSLKRRVDYFSFSERDKLGEIILFEFSWRPPLSDSNKVRLISRYDILSGLDKLGN